MFHRGENAESVGDPASEDAVSSRPDRSDTNTGDEGDGSVGYREEGDDVPDFAGDVVDRDVGSGLAAGVDDEDGALSLDRQLDGELCDDGVPIPGDDPRQQEERASARAGRVRVGGQEFVERAMGMRGWPFPARPGDWPNRWDSIAPGVLR